MVRKVKFLKKIIFLDLVNFCIVILRWSVINKSLVSSYNNNNNNNIYTWFFKSILDTWSLKEMTKVHKVKFSVKTDKTIALTVALELFEAGRRPRVAFPSLTEAPPSAVYAAFLSSPSKDNSNLINIVSSRIWTNTILRQQWQLSGNRLDCQSRGCGFESHPGQKLKIYVMRSL